MQLDDTSVSDRAAALDWLWERVLHHVRLMRLDGTGAPYVVGHDDVMMREAAADDCFAWIDDCEARLGCDVSDARAALLEFVIARDGTTDPDIDNTVLREAVCFARARLHGNHPVIRGLEAIVESLPKPAAPRGAGR